MFLNSTIRTAQMQAIIDNAGSGATLKYYNGTQPAAGGALSGNTLLATLTWTGVPIGTASAGVLNWDEAGAVQSNGSHVAGTPTFCRLETSGAAIVADFEIPTDGAFTGAVATGVDITLSTWTITAGHSA